MENGLKKIELDQLVDVKSSNIKSVGFDGETAYVVFSKGTIYSYPKVSKEDFDKLAKAQSVGSYFAKTLKLNKEAKKLENTVLVKKEEEYSEEK